MKLHAPMAAHKTPSYMNDLIKKRGAGQPSKQPEDMSEILALIRDGKSHREISKGLGVSHGVLCLWLSKPEILEHSSRAMLESAEAWLDRGLDAIEHTEDANRGRYIAQECARRAGIRNMHYRDRMSIDAKLAGNLTIQLVNFAALPALPNDTDTE